MQTPVALCAERTSSHSSSPNAAAQPLLLPLTRFIPFPGAHQSAALTVHSSQRSCRQSWCHDGRAPFTVTANGLPAAHIAMRCQPPVGMRQRQKCLSNQVGQWGGQNRVGEGWGVSGAGGAPDALPSYSSWSAPFLPPFRPRLFGVADLVRVRLGCSSFKPSSAWNLGACRTVFSRTNRPRCDSHVCRSFFGFSSFGK